MQPVMFNPGDLVNLVDGRQGIVQQMSDDGGVIVEVDGMTEEIGLDSIIDNMSKIQTQNEDSSTDGDSKVLENVPEKTLESVVASLPKRNDGTIDYKAMTPQQQYEYTSLSESPQTALEDLRADIENKRSEVSKSESQIEKASGGERASLRDEIRVKKQELADLEAFYQTVAPDAEVLPKEMLFYQKVLLHPRRKFRLTKSQIFQNHLFPWTRLVILFIIRRKSVIL